MCWKKKSDWTAAAAAAAVVANGIDYRLRSFFCMCVRELFAYYI